MPEVIDFSPDFVNPALLGRLRADISVAEKADALARLAQLAEGNRRGLEKHTREFREMYEEACRRLPVEGLAMLADRIGEGEAGARELLYPWMDALRQTMSVPSDEGRRYIRELLEISEAWLTLYRETRDKLLQLAAERRPADRILRARPVKGDIDHEALSREFIERFPKIRAALAE
jgi:acyl carrier protein phosphodiesterase